MDVQFNWTNIVQTIITPTNRIYAVRDCCIEKTFRYPTTQPWVETLGAEYFRDNYRFESNYEDDGWSRANANECPQFFVAQTRKYVTEQIHRRIAVARSRLVDFVRIRIGKKQLPCRNDECRFVVSVYVDVDLQVGYIEQQWYRQVFSRVQVQPPGPNPPDSVIETGHPTTWSTFVATSSVVRTTIVFVKEFETLPETFSFNSSDDWECVQSACNSDSPRNACGTVEPDFTQNPNPINVYIQSVVRTTFLTGIGTYNPTWTNPNTGEVCQPSPNQTDLTYTIIAPLNRRIDPFTTLGVNPPGPAFGRAVSVDVQTDFFANTVSVCAATPTISVASCQSSNPEPEPETPI
jgi:hypothetical protein